MPNTFTQLYIQVVFAVQGRQNFISKHHREQLHKYITGIVQERRNKMLSIFCMPDHVHFFMGLKPSQNISDLVRDVKASSSLFINDNKWLPGKFNWQEGFGAFSYGRNDIDYVVQYILNQEAHHKQKTFKEEYIGLLKEFDIAYDEKYLFEFYD